MIFFSDSTNVGFVPMIRLKGNLTPWICWESFEINSKTVLPCDERYLSDIIVGKSEMICSLQILCIPQNFVYLIKVSMSIHLTFVSNLSFNNCGILTVIQQVSGSHFTSRGEWIKNQISWKRSIFCKKTINAIIFGYEQIFLHFNSVFGSPGGRN